ncbi:MAG: hypothetical protein HKN24_02795 [Acidimicrobiales bacterium]|nr:hypothetical protein [Acidimicrobiales bacterium]
MTGSSPARPVSSSPTLRMGIRTFRERLRAAMTAAQSGERIIVTIRGVPVAQLGPIESDPGTTTLESLSAAGLVNPPQRRDRPADPNPHVLAADVRLDRVIDQVRGRV